jgi:hypothetical protein
VHHKDRLRPPTRQPARSQFPSPQIHQIAHQLFRLRGPGDASHPMPWEISYGAYIAVRPNPSERRLGPLSVLSRIFIDRSSGV